MNAAKLFNTMNADVESDFLNELVVYQDGIPVSLKAWQSASRASGAGL